VSNELLGMRKLCLIAASLLALAATPLPLRAQGLLPDHFGNWTRKSCDNKPAVITLGEESADKLGASLCLYTSDDQKLTVWTEKYHDPSSAYEVYTSGLHPGMVPSFIANNSAVEKDRLWLLTGNVVLRVESQQLASETDLRQLVKSIEGHVDHTPLPPIRSYLPEYGLVSGTQRYALGAGGFQQALQSLQRQEFGLLTNEIGFNIGAETMLAQYQGGHGSGVLLLIEYPTPQLAEQHWKHLDAALIAANKQSAAVIERKGSLLSLVLSPSSEEFAKALRKSVNYETQVTWNEPSQTLTDPPWTSTIAKIFIGTGVFMVIAVVLGVAFGGVRVITKRLFPGKVFDRPENIEVLQLGLSGKKIDPRDLY
jgi:hypothetical protein